MEINSIGAVWYWLKSYKQMYKQAHENNLIACDLMMELAWYLLPREKEPEIKNLINRVRDYGVMEPQWWPDREKLIKQASKYED